MGYMVFVEQLDPIFDFWQMVKKYEAIKNRITGVEPKKNFRWITGSNIEEVVVKDQREFDVIEKILINPLLKN